jgi:hypothetical protein
VTQDVESIFWVVIVTVIVIKKVHMDLCLIGMVTERERERESCLNCKYTSIVKDK